jgi:CheY-like chemotaxis protein
MFLIVCSRNEDPQFMLDCVQAGAADYLLRPLRPDVIKTLFLVIIQWNFICTPYIHYSIYRHYFVGNTIVHMKTILYLLVPLALSLQLFLQLLQL